MLEFLLNLQSEVSPMPSVSGGIVISDDPLNTRYLVVTTDGKFLNWTTKTYEDPPSGGVPLPAHLKALSPIVAAGPISAVKIDTIPLDVPIYPYPQITVACHVNQAGEFVEYAGYTDQVVNAPKSYKLTTVLSPNG